MSHSKYITHSGGCRTGTMKCSKCKNNIKGFYLVKDIYDLKSRGNENDTCEIYCYNCSSRDRAWFEYWQSEIKRRDDIISDYRDKIEKFCHSFGFSEEPV